MAHKGPKGCQSWASRSNTGFDEDDDDDAEWLGFCRGSAGLPTVQGQHGRGLLSGLVASIAFGIWRLVLSVCSTARCLGFGFDYLTTSGDGVEVGAHPRNL